MHPTHEELELPPPAFAVAPHSSMHGPIFLYQVLFIYVQCRVAHQQAGTRRAFTSQVC